MTDGVKLYICVFSSVNSHSSVKGAPEILTVKKEESEPLVFQVTYKSYVKLSYVKTFDVFAV